VAPEVLRHRLILSYDALAANVTTDEVIRHLLSTITAPRVAPQQDVVNMPPPASMPSSVSA
jgi:MoxR-like ATPase